MKVEARVQERRIPMNSGGRLSDHEHPSIRAKVEKLTANKINHRDKIESFFYFVRDQIKFGFPPKWDLVKASETLEYGLGYCTSKATLFLALCRAADIPARIHTGLIDIGIMRGIFPSFAFPFLPSSGSHSWMEIRFKDEWKSIDSYINDKPFYEGALNRLQESGKMTAFSISQAKGKSSCEFNFGEKGFVQMGAVLEDHGAWDDYSEYMSSDKYASMNRMQLMAYPLIASISNRNIDRLRV
jgi:hypothetical protein